MRRILIVGPYVKKVGGIKSHIDNVLSFIQIDSKHRVEVIDIGKGGDFRLLTSWFKIPFKTLDFDVAYVQVSNRGSLVRKTIFSFLCRTKLVAHIHGSNFSNGVSNSKLMSTFFRMLAKNSDLIITLHESEVIQLSKIASFNHAIVPNSCEDMTLELDNRIHAGNISCKGHHKKALFLGSIGYRKGIPDLIHVWRELEGKICSDLMLAGPIDKKFNLIQLIGNATNIRYLGVLDKHETRKAINQCDFLILPSNEEGQPIALIEGMSASKPFISTLLPGIIALDVESEFSILIPKNDQKALKDSIIEMSSNPCLWAKKGETARINWKLHQNPLVNFERILNLLDSVG
jgi:glycosyltransferase involved in cell wall biosynthesis